MPINNTAGEKGNQQWMRFASTGSQMLGAIVASVWLGIWIDSKTKTLIPWFALTLPVLTVVGLLIRIMKETRPKRDANKQNK